MAQTLLAQVYLQWAGAPLNGGADYYGKAAQMALNAEVKQLVIGHFSARYEDETVLLNEAAAIFPQTILARENMCIELEGGAVHEK